MKKGKKSIVTVILAFILAVAGGVISNNEGEAPQEETVQVVQESESIGQEESEVAAEKNLTVEEAAEVEVEVEEAEEIIAEETEEIEYAESVEIEFAVEEEEELTFRKESNLTSHYEKHGIEMGFDSAEEYLEAANAVVNNPDSLHKLEGEDGDDVYYLEATNEFVVVSKDGYIRTYFNPSDGLDYFNRQ